MEFKLIVCINSKNVIGRNGSLLFHIKNDMMNFKRLTSDNIVVMGRKTFDSLPNKKPLPQRENIVLTSNESFNAEGITKMMSIDEICLKYKDKNDKDKILFVIGGASIYNQFLAKDLIDEIILTRVVSDTSLEPNDAVIEPYWEDNKKWKKTFETDIIHDTKTHLDYEYVVYQKINNHD